MNKSYQYFDDYMLPKTYSSTGIPVPQTVMYSQTDYALWMIAVQEDGTALSSCPHPLINYELCKTAVCQKGDALRFCPREFVDDKLDLITMAINNDYKSIQYVNGNHKYYSLLCKEVLRIDGDSLCYMKKDKITLKLIRLALSNHNGNIMSIISHENFVYSVSKLTITDRAEVYAIAVGICSAVVFHVPYDIQLNTESQLDDVKYEKICSFSYDKGAKTNIIVYIGKHSKRMTVDEFRQFLTKWYPEHAYLKVLQTDDDEMEINLKPHVKSEWCKRVDDSYTVNPYECINTDIPRHMYDTCTFTHPCNCRMQPSHITYTINRNQLALKSRLREMADPIRGDLAIVPMSGNWFVPSVNPKFDLHTGCLKMINGDKVVVDESSTKMKKEHKLIID